MAHNKISQDIKTSSFRSHVLTVICLSYQWGEKYLTPFCYTSFFRRFARNISLHFHGHTRPNLSTSSHTWPCNVQISSFMNRTRTCIATFFGSGWKYRGNVCLENSRLRTGHRSVYTRFIKCMSLNEFAVWRNCYHYFQHDICRWDEK